jgi:hypothetical protein
MAGGVRGGAAEGARRRACADGGRRRRGRQRTDGMAWVAAMTRGVRVR